METQEVFTREEFGNDESGLDQIDQDLWYGPVIPEELVEVRVHYSFIQNWYETTCHRTPSWNPTRGNNRTGIKFYTNEFGLNRLVDQLEYDIYFYGQEETHYSASFNANEVRKSERTLAKVEKLLEEKFDYKIG